MDAFSAQWVGKSAGATQLLIEIKPAAIGRSYLIMCTVSGDPAPKGFLIHGPNGIEFSQFVDSTGELQHLYMTLESATTVDFHTFVIQFSPEDIQSVFFWTFYSCEVRNL